METQHQNTKLHSITGGKVPPFDVEAEEQLLGVILFVPEALSAIVGWLPSDAFAISSHQNIYKGFVSLNNAGKPTDMIHICDWLKAHKLLNSVGGKAKIAQLLDRIIHSPIPTGLDDLANLVLDKYQSRQLIAAGNDTVEIGYDETKLIADRLNEAESKIFAIADAQRRGGLSPADEIAVEVFTDIQTGITPAIATSFYDLNDLLIGGLFPGSLYVVCAVPGCGKSAFSNRLAYDAAKDHSLTSAIFSMEMPKKQVINRFLAEESSIPLSRLKSRNVLSHEWSLLSTAVDTISSVSLHVDDTENISAAEMISRVRKLKRQRGKLGCVVVDYLQLMVGDDHAATRNLELAGISRRFKLMARELDCPVIVLSQLNRNIAMRANKRPVLDDIRDTAALGQDADVVLALYRDELYNSDTPDKGIVEVSVIKNRDGDTGTISLLFDGAMMRFRNLVK